MATQAVNPYTLGTTTSATTTANAGLSSMKSEDFFKLLISELKQQDPLQPAKTADLVNEVSQIRSIELSKSLTDSLSSLTQQEHTSGMSALLGKYITASVADANGNTQTIAGVVTGVRFDADGSAVLELDNGQTVPAAAITRIQTTQAAPAKSGGTTGSSTNASGTTAGTSTSATGGANTASGAAGTTTGATAAAGSNGTAANAATTGDKSGQTSKQSSGGGLFPWLHFNAGIDL